MVEHPDAQGGEPGICPGSPAMPRRLLYLVLALLVLGGALRLRAYVHNRSLWFDEAALALDLRQHPLVLGKGAEGRMMLYPIAFLAASKLSVSALGDSEYAVRLFPLVSGLAALGLFYVLARRCLTPNALAVAVCLFAVCPKLIYHAVEAKPFSSDVAVATALAYLTVCALAGPLCVGMTLLLAVAGAAAVWLSYPAAFCLAGFGAVMGISALAKRQWGRAARLCAVGLAWVASFGTYYCLGFRAVSRSPGLLKYWGKDFVPLPPTSWSDLKWFVDDGLDIFHDPGGLAFPALAAVVFCAGLVSLVRRRRAVAVALVLPMGVMLLASGLHLYPFASRLLLFCVPLMFLFVAEGAERIRGLLSAKARVAGVVFILALLAAPCGRAARGAVRPRGYEETRPVLAYVAANRQAGDTLFVYHGALVAVRYYSPRYGLEQMDIVWGRQTAKDREDKDWSRCAAELDKLRGHGRTWFVFSHVRRGRRDPLLEHLDGMGTRLLEVEATGAGGYLYDLNKPAAPAP